MNEYQRGFNEGLELAALKVQNLLIAVPFTRLTAISEVIRDQKLTQPPQE